ncbi:hypothetical protein FIBSPDRAFT_886294 [Athelia psychrophila]|uniref:Uncharacterized protein n=1 Tax=Athelia psychrophila TaxID=1759441 RepID=A0A166QZI7_9AGAM|nr:hypothetical protein FIBSPDRAFT_886294 [Fibularhizoctonia sp. CBS 109695]
MTGREVDVETLATECVFDFHLALSTRVLSQQSTWFKLTRLKISPVTQEIGGGGTPRSLSERLALAAPSEARDRDTESGVIIQQDPTKFVGARSSASQFLDSIILGDNCQKTRDLAGQYTLNPKQALWALKYNRMGTPPPLPDSEWLHILTSRPVNLDVINTGAFSTELDDKVTHKLGDFSISTGGIS